MKKHYWVDLVLKVDQTRVWRSDACLTPVEKLELVEKYEEIGILIFQECSHKHGCDDFLIESLEPTS